MSFSNFKNKLSLLESLVESEYRMNHRAPDSKSGSPLYDVTLNGIYPDDFYSNMGLRYYGDGHDYDAKTWKLIVSYRDKPESLVTIYRAVPKTEGSQYSYDINVGDWVAITRKYAMEHGERVLDGNYDIVTKKVKASEIYTAGDSFHEWGYSPKN